MTERRFNTIQSILSETGADALWISSLPDIRWACGFTGSNGLLIVRPDGAHFITDSRYTTQADQEVIGADVHVRGPSLVETADEIGLLRACRSVVFQSNHVSVAQLQQLEETFPDVEWEGRRDLFIRAVASKDDFEIEAIRRAQQVTEAVLAYLIEWIRPGMSEQAIAAEIVYQQLQRGAERMSFEPIVASGPNSALPHARPTRRVVEVGDILLLDFGCVLDGYASDMTRTLAVGEPDPEARKVYDIVLEAQERAIESAHAGVISSELDAAARELIADRGYGEAFAHSLGHGVGLQTHEWPRVSYTTDYELPRNAVVSIEPGIYLPGRFGIRIEDLIVLREKHAEVLTTAPKSWTNL